MFALQNLNSNSGNWYRHRCCGNWNLEGVGGSPIFPLPSKTVILKLARRKTGPSPIPTLSSTKTIITTVVVLAMMLILTLRCGSCEFVANVPALSYLQLGYLGTWAPGYLGTWIPRYLQLCTLFNKQNVVKPKSNCWYFSLRSVCETKARALFWLWS